MTALAFDFVASSAPSQVHAKRVPVLVSNRLETFTKSVETFSNDNLKVSSQETAGRPLSGVACLQDMVRELADLIAPRQAAKVLYPLIATDLRKYAPNISLRRVRAIYNGEVARLWDEEAMALRMALADRRNAKARREFASAAAQMTKMLAANGVPLSADQHGILNSLTGDMA